MPKVTKTLGNNKARACESLGFAQKKWGGASFDTSPSKRPLTNVTMMVEDWSMFRKEPILQERLISNRMSNSILKQVVY